NRAAESVYWYAIEYSNKDGNGEGRAAFAINADENNFSTDEVKAGDAVLWYEKADISVLNEKYLYGGKNQWYYGIWTGDAGADFSEKKLLAARNGVFNKESFEGKRENERQKKLAPDTIEAGNTPARESEKQEGYYLPETDGNNADRLIGSVAKKYDEKKKSFI
ncbi:hypothetical protein, partial [Treponema socranskii]|uniref:hypothetical protein n=1 Tax=Treponema socranskii TaxID=53419 RepID=UPI003D925D63